MIDYIRSIKGTDFLFFYFIFALIMHFITIILIKIASIGSSNIAKQLSAEEIIVLKDQEPKRELVKLYLFRLWKEGLINIDYDSSNIELNENEIINYKKQNKSLDKISETILLELAKNGDKDSIINLQNLQQINFFIKSAREEMKKMGLVKSTIKLIVCRLIKYSLFLFTMLIGFIKLALGILNDKPIRNLFILLLFVALMFLTISTKTTKQAEKHIDLLKEEYEMPPLLSDLSNIDTYVALYDTNYYNRPENIMFFSFMNSTIDSYLTSDNSNESNDSYSSGCSSCSGCSGGGCGGCGDY